MIVAICSAKEEPWIGEVVEHLYANGVDEVLVSSPGYDEVREQVIGAKGSWTLQEGPFAQDAEMTRLAHMAVSHWDPDWIVPFDADEYWIDPLGQTVADVLNSVPDDVGVIHCAMFKHTTYELRHTVQNPMGKVVFRPSPDMRLEWGQHGVTGVPGQQEHGLLEVRELQYRDRAHFDAKIDKARRLFATGSVPAQYGGHMRRLVDADPAELDRLWRLHLQQETVHDPIPVRRRDT